MPFNQQILDKIGQSHEPAVLKDADVFFTAISARDINGIELLISKNDVFDSFDLRSVLLPTLIQLITFLESSVPLFKERVIIRRLIENFKIIYNGDEEVLKGKSQPIFDQVFADVNKLLDSEEIRSEERNNLHAILYGTLRLLNKKLVTTTVFSSPSQYIAISLGMYFLGLDYSVCIDNISALLSKLRIKSANFDSLLSSSASSTEKSAFPVAEMDSSSYGLFATAADYLKTAATAATSVASAATSVAGAAVTTVTTAASSVVGVAATAAGAILASTGYDLDEYPLTGNAHRTIPPSVKSVSTTREALREKTIIDNDPATQDYRRKLNYDKGKLAGEINHHAYFSEDRIDLDGESSRSRSPIRRPRRRNLLIEDDLMSAAIAAKRDYKRWFAGVYSGRSTSTYFLERGIFHTINGQRNVELFINRLREANSVEAKKVVINKFLSERKSYKRNSFVSYLLDQLIRIDRDDSPWKEIRANENRTYNKADVLPTVRT